MQWRRLSQVVSVSRPATFAEHPVLSFSPMNSISLSHRVSRMWMPLASACPPAFIPARLAALPTRTRALISRGLSPAAHKPPTPQILIRRFRPSSVARAPTVPASPHAWREGEGEGELGGGARKREREMAPPPSPLPLSPLHASRFANGCSAHMRRPRRQPAA